MGKTMSGTGSPESPAREPSPYEKNVNTRRDDVDVEAAAPQGWAQWFGGPATTVGPRIGPVLDSITLVAEDSDDSASAIVHRQKAAEQGADIQYRSCSWQMVCAPSPRSLIATGAGVRAHHSGGCFAPHCLTVLDADCDLALDRHVALFRIHLLGKDISPLKCPGSAVLSMALGRYPCPRLALKPIFAAEPQEAVLT